MSNSYLAQTLSIEGPDAIAFAQAQFSSKVDSLADGRWQFSAWLDPQGRVRNLFHLVRLGDDRLRLLLRGGGADVMAAALQRFVFRSKVSISAHAPLALDTHAALPMHETRADGDTFQLGCGDYSMRITPAHRDDTWRVQQVRDGWPWLPAQTPGSLLSSALSLQRLQAVVIDKGCYPGQEIVARLHFRGGQKRHLHRVELSQPATAGELLQAGERDRVQLLDVIATDTGIEALAILSDEFSAQAIDGNLQAPHDRGTIRLLTVWPA